jgi:hypothetical protein
MDWNEFNRELQNRVNDPGLRYMLGFIYERQLDMAKQIDANNEICLALAQTMQNVVGLTDVIDARMQTLRKLTTGQASDAEFHSVPLTNDD